LAQERGLGLAGFLRADGMNVSAQPERFGLRGGA
jgi:formate dehydrogenase assembly factor FdhD